jgi:hypothetical protein
MPETFTSYLSYFSLMKNLVALCAIMVLSSTVIAYAADPVPATPVPATPVQATAMEVTPLNAAPNSAAAVVASPKAGSSLGEYKSVACTTNSAFGTNNCNQCFEGEPVKVSQKLTGLFDNWNNPSTTPLVAYREEQKTPNMVRFGNSTWSASPSDETKLWKYSSEIVWVPSSGGKNQFILAGGQKVKFVEAELMAGYTLEKTDRKVGEMVGMLRFPVVSHAIDGSTATEGPADTHYECVSYSLAASPVMAGTPATPATPAKAPGKPVPAAVTQTQTGPESLLLIAAAFFIAFGLMFSLRKRM